MKKKIIIIVLTLSVLLLNSCAPTIGYTYRAKRAHCGFTR
jgi:hypothetical protein